MEWYEQHKKTHVTQGRKTKTQKYGKSMLHGQGYIQTFKLPAIALGTLMTLMTSAAADVINHNDAELVDSNLVDFDWKTCLGQPGILHDNSSWHSFISSTEKVSANVM